MSKDLKEVSEPCGYLREHSQHGEQQVQGPWGVSVSGMFEEQQEACVAEAEIEGECRRWVSDGKEEVGKVRRVL